MVSKVRTYRTPLRLIPLSPAPPQVETAREVGRHPVEFVRIR